MAVDAESEKSEPWLLRGSGVASLVTSLAAPAHPEIRRPQSLFEFVDSLRRRRDLQLLTSKPPEEVDETADLPSVYTTPNALYNSALVRVALRLCGRGCPSDIAIVYRMEDEELVKFHRSRTKRGGVHHIGGDLDEEMEVRDIIFYLANSH